MLVRVRDWVTLVMSTHLLLRQYESPGPYGSRIKGRLCINWINVSER